MIGSRPRAGGRELPVLCPLGGRRTLPGLRGSPRPSPSDEEILGFLARLPAAKRQANPPFAAGAPPPRVGRRGTARVV